MTVTVCKICCHAEPDSDHEQTIISQLQKILPAEFHHDLCSHEALNGDSFKCVLRLKLLTEGEANRWLTAFKASSFMTWRIMKTYPEAGRYNKYRVDLRCQHNTRSKPGKAPKKPGKDTQCPAMMYLVVKRTTASRNRRTRSRDPHIQQGLCFIVTLRNQHNHALLGPEVMRRRDVSKETADALLEFYQKGHTPTSALEMLKHNLREEFGENYDQVLGDRAVCPDLQFCYRLYYSMIKQANGASTKQLLRNLEIRLASFNQEHDDVCTDMKQIDGNGTVVALCTPLMKRVHANIEDSAQVVFVDSAASAGRHPHHLYVLLTRTPVGGLPLGVLISISKTESAISAGLELLRSLLPEGAFYGQGTDGPQVVLTHDCLPLRQAIHAMYPNTELMLTAPQVLKATWRWLWDSSNGIPSPDRPTLFNIVKSLVQADSSADLEEKHQSALKLDIVHKYATFQDYLSKFYQARAEWSVHCRDKPPVPRDPPIDLSEAAMHVFKDKILYRMKGYDIGQLVDFVLKRMDASYERRLQEITKKGMSALINSKYFLQGRDLNHAGMVQVSESQFTVPSLSSRQEHLVDMELGMCTCSVGIKGGPCKHQQAVVRKFRLPSFDLSSTLSPQLKKLFGTIVTGPADDVQDDSLFRASKQQPESALNLVPMSVVQGPVPQPTETSQCSNKSTGDAPGVWQHKEAAASLEQRLKRVFDTIGEKLQADPAVYRTAVRSFVTSFEKMPSDSATVSALYTFGRSPGEASAAKRLKVVARKSLQRASQLGGQPNGTVILQE